MTAAPELAATLAPDHYLLWDELSEPELDVRLRVRRFVDEHVLPAIGPYWERAELPWPLLERLGELGVVGELGSATAEGLVQMELCRGDASLGTFVGVQGGLAMGSIALHGSDEQKERWLPAMARLDAIGAFALTEPAHGSDSVALETRARRDGDAWVLDGRKRWIGNGSIADVVVVWARAEDGEVNGYLVERDAPGFQARVIEGKGSLRSVWQADLWLAGVRVPAENRLPGVRSFRDVARVLTRTRADVAWSALGLATGAYEAALAHVTSRVQFGRPLAGFQLVQDRLVRMIAELTSMQLHCVRVARLTEQGRLTPAIASLAKLHNTRHARQVIGDARDLLGGEGILVDRHVMRHLADVESLRTYEGTESMLTLIVGRELTGESAFA